MKLNLPFTSRSNADLVRKTIKNQEYWLENLSAFASVELEKGNSVSLADLSDLPCFGDSEQSQTSLPVGQAMALSEARKAHLAIHSEVENEYPEIWVFWCAPEMQPYCKDGGDVDAELSSLVRSIDAMAANGFADLDYRGLDGLRRISNWSPSETLVDDDEYWDRHYVTFKAQGQQLGLVFDREVGLGEPSTFRIRPREGDPQQFAALLENFQTSFDDDSSRKALEINLEFLRSRLKDTLNICAQAHSALSDIAREAMQLFEARRSSEREDMRGS